MSEKENLRQLKEEYDELTKKLQGLTEEELKEVSGGLFDEYLKPIKDIGPIDFDWSKFAPQMPNELGLLKEETKRDVETKKVEITGKIESDIDYTEEKWKPLF